MTSTAHLQVLSDVSLDDTRHLFGKVGHQGLCKVRGGLPSRLAVYLVNSNPTSVTCCRRSGETGVDGKTYQRQAPDPGG
jgi:hypothetical protein